MNEFPTSIGTSDRDSITLLGHDLARDLLGKVGFGELAFWLVAMRRPTPGEQRLFEAVLVALADHGLTPTAISARLTLASAPESVQGAMAAGLLGGGSRFLGVTEDAGSRMITSTSSPEGRAWSVSSIFPPGNTVILRCKAPGIRHPPMMVLYLITHSCRLSKVPLAVPSPPSDRRCQTLR